MSATRALIVPKVEFSTPPNKEINKVSSDDGACLYWMITGTFEDAGAAAASGEILLFAVAVAVAVAAALAAVTVEAIKLSTISRRRRDMATPDRTEMSFTVRANLAGFVPPRKASIR